jgi:hypothetical protein
MAWDVSEGDCESACEGVPGDCTTVTAESGVSRLSEGEGMSVAVRATPPVVDGLDTRVVKPSFL